ANPEAGYSYRDLDAVNRLADVYALAIQRMRSIEALRESEEQYRSIFEAAANLILSVDPDGNIIDCNDRIREILGYDKEEIIGRQMPEIVYQGNWEFSENSLKELFLPRSSRNMEQKMLKKDGGVIEVRIHSSSLEDDKGNTLKFICIIEDITSRNRIKHELQNAQKLESLGLLAGGIAHDFNNLLAGLFGYIELAKTSSPPESKAVFYLGKAMGAFQRARDLTHQLLTFSKGGMPIKKVISVANMVKDAANLALSGSEIRCEHCIENDIWPVEADPGQMNQVISNIVINARQAMPEGGLIKVSAVNMPSGPEHVEPLKGTRCVEISIEDSGIGIPKTHIHKIFDPFFTTKQQGSGLGLAISFSIIKKHSGHLTVESELGRGTIFRIYLPASSKRSVTDYAHGLKTVRGRGKILLMDDEEMIQEMAGTMLKDLGYQVEYASDGKEAVDAYKKALESGDRFEAVILDLTVPGAMGGRKAIRKLLEIDPEVTAIVSSGYSDDPILAKPLDHGFKGVLIKPYRMNEISGTLARILKKK
ncbi:MAG: PAS domain S-box protein, partial [Nitrospirae bacterium]|nr:PAS domain S-box protein [Nitrospirota bacterium]